MADSLQAPNNSQAVVLKLRTVLDKINDRLSNQDNLSINNALAELNSSFKKFFSTLGDPEFEPKEFKTGEPATSELYNSNLKGIFDDLDRFYKEIRTLSDAQLSSFNYSQIVIQEVTKKADSLASIVLDLNILNNFTRGDVIVAGDDFRNTQYIDSEIGIASELAELMPNGAGLSLARNDARNIASQATIDIIPLEPGQEGGVSVNTVPTAGNIARFYEGNYYNFLGFARPEGGKFNIRHTYVPPPEPEEEEKLPGNRRFIGAGGGNMAGVIGTLARGSNFGGGGGQQGGGGGFSNPLLNFARGSNRPPSAGPASPFEDPPGTTYDPEANPQPEREVQPTGPVGDIYVDMGATEDQKKVIRRKMFDNNADTYWECEYLLKTSEPLLPDLQDAIVVDNESTAGGDQSVTSSSGTVTVSIEDADREARANDAPGVDLAIDLIITLPGPDNVNMVTLNPVLFAANAFVEVEDISTALEDDGEFETVDGWDNIRFPRTITPEANEFLTTSQVGASLAPGRSTYLGQGIYPFPVRIAKKIKVRLRMREPVSSPYERTYIMIQRELDTETTIITKKTKGTFRI